MSLYGTKHIKCNNIFCLRRNIENYYDINNVRYKFVLNLLKRVIDTNESILNWVLTRSHTRTLSSTWFTKPEKIIAGFSHHENVLNRNFNAKIKSEAYFP